VLKNVGNFLDREVTEKCTSTLGIKVGKNLCLIGISKLLELG
jgi:hypothetical protein